MNHPFAWNTEHPTHLDVYIYTQLVRIFYLKDSVFNHWYEKLAFDNYPKCQKLIQAMQAREEFKDAYTKMTPQHH